MTPEERAAWLEERRTGIGGTDIAAIVGLGFRTVHDVWLDKTGRAKPYEPEGAAAERMHWGNILEPVIAAEFERRTGYTVKPVGLRRHKRYSWALGTPDGHVYDGDTLIGSLEIKTVGTHAAQLWGADGLEAGDGIVPPGYRVQKQWYMEIDNLERGWFAALIGGQELRIFPVRRDQVVIDALILKARDFWRLVQSDQPPPPDASRQYSALIAALYCTGRDEVTTLPAEARELCAQYKAASDAIKAATERKQLAQNKLQAMLGKSTRGAVDQWRVGWSNVNTFDAAQFKAQQPDMAARYSKPAAIDTAKLRKDHPDIFEEFRRPGGRRFVAPRLSTKKGD